MRGRAALAALLLVGCSAVGAHAHPLAPAVLEVREEASGRAVVSWKTPIAASAHAGQPMLPSECAPTAPPSVRADDVARVAEGRIACDGGLIGKRFGVSGRAGASSDVLLRLALADGRVVHRVLRPGAEAFVVPERPSAVDVARDYAALGVTHIAGGFDHLLFLLALCALASTWRRLAATVTAFTAGHGVALSCAALGWVALPAGPIEAAIALSIVALACEVARGPGARASLLQRRPWALAFAFGLLHGLGFAGALAETGLPDGEIALALVGFNAGIEAGQLAFVIAVALVGRALLPRLAGRAKIPGLARSARVPDAGAARSALAYAVGSVGACLALERMAAVFGLGFA